MGNADSKSASVSGTYGLAGIGAILTLAVLAGGISSPALAQEGVRFEAAAAVERLTYRYRFDNDSSFDTPFLVPHFFEQRYERTGPVFGIGADYELSGRRASTAVSFAPERRASGSDFDTFFQPGGDIAKSGTAGDVGLASLRVAQTLSVYERTTPSALVAIGVLFAWQRDRADFLPADRVVTHTMPPSETREFITDRERTVSQTFEVGLEGTLHTRAGGWKIEASARLVPALRARLLVQLPDKYPGRDIVFSAAGWSGSGTVRFMRDGERGAIGAWVSIEQAGSWRRRAEFDRNAAAIGAVVAFGSLR